MNLTRVIVLAVMYGGYDNQQPRTGNAHPDGSMILRLKSAQENTFEGIVIYGACVLAASHFKLDDTVAAKLAILYALTRVVFIVTYETAR